MTNTSFFEKCKGIALILGVVLFGTAAILFSTTPAQADAPQTMYATGKYQMAISTINNENTGNTFWYIIVWDTETGRSKYYYGSVSNGTQVAASKFQLPSSPL